LAEPLQAGDDFIFAQTAVAQDELIGVDTAVFGDDVLLDGIDADPEACYVVKGGG